MARLPMAVAMAACVYMSEWYIAVTILWIAIATDIADGYIARKNDAATPLGGLLDHGSDAIFVTLTLAAWTTHNWVPIALPVLIPMAFAQYMLDSDALRGKPLRASQLGRYNGIAYFVLAGFPVMQLTLGLTPIPFDYFVYLGWGLVITTLISMTDRAVTLYRVRRGAP